MTKLTKKCSFEEFIKKCDEFYSTQCDSAHNHTYCNCFLHSAQGDTEYDPHKSSKNMHKFYRYLYNLYSDVTENMNLVYMYSQARNYTILELGIKFNTMV